jgi:isoquinoline 1-oxidoreductase subunit beta
MIMSIPGAGMGSSRVISRRSFLVATAASGLTLCCGDVRQIVGASQALAAGNFVPTVWYSIAPDGIVTVMCGKTEMGQHIASAITQVVAEELCADWKDVRFELAPNDPKYGDAVYGVLLTGGSFSINNNFEAMSRAGAAGRIVLIETGAQIMGVPQGECYAQNSQVIHAKSGRALSYAQIVSTGRAQRILSADEMKAIVLKSPDQYTLLGQSVRQLDIPAKTNGTAKFGIDVFLRGMVYGKPVVPPVRYGATVKTIDDAAARKIPGFIKAIAIEDPTLTITGWVVAVADTYETAIAAAEKLTVTYDNGPNASVSSASLFAEAKRLQQNPKTAAFVRKDGDAAGALANATQVIEAEYTTGINIHAPLEPMNATVEEKGGVWHIHSGNQFATRTILIAAQALGIDPGKIVLHPYFVGGGFGRRLEADMVIPALLASRAVGKPLKLIYGRPDDMLMDFTRPLTYQRIRAGLDAQGQPVAVEHDVVSAWPSVRLSPGTMPTGVDGNKFDNFVVNGADFFYTVPNHTVRAILNELAQSATPSGQLRSVGAGWIFWALESAIDELAHAARRDPVEFRLALLDGAGDNAGGALRLANALRTAVGHAGYGAVLPKGEGMGVACSSAQERKTASWTACVAHVAVAESGAVTVKKLVIVSDVGRAVNPDGVAAQLEGAALWGLSLALHEQATLKDGAIQETTFGDYTPLRMDQVPEIEVHVIANGGDPTGCGEPATTVVAPAIANAIFNASGARVRIRSLPITAEAVKAAMA